MKPERRWICFPATVLLCITANGFVFVPDRPHWWLVLGICGLIANLLPLLTLSPKNGFRLCILAHGNSCLRQFIAGVVFSILFWLGTLPFLSLRTGTQWLIGLLICIAVLALTFWNGILCLYFTSVQLGIKLRLIGLLCGWIPIVNIIVLLRILKVTSKEISFEAQKKALDRSRRQEKICQTKYPILLVHGVFFRDTRYFNYWGRIPSALIANGATIFYGNHPSAASIADSAQVLAQRIREIREQTGAEKVNIIAHSKGGLDCRYAIAFCGIEQDVASLTTINTPHRGCRFADCLLQKIPHSVQQQVAHTYNRALSRLGEPEADFMAAVTDLTSSRCSERDASMPLPQGIFCQSFGSKLNQASGGKFPLNLSYHLVHFFDGSNDGLVGEDSFSWGPNYTLLTTPHPEGISHGDIIDLNRENIPGFDVREFYVELVQDLKNRGL